MKFLSFAFRKKNLLFLLAGGFMLKFSSAQNINLDSIITSAMNAKHCPGVAALILKKGIPVWEHNYGYAKLEDSIPVTENTSFMLASISKTFICAAIMQLVEQGALELDSNVNNYLPFEFHNPHYPDSVITVMDLLTHTSSIKDNWNLLYSLYVYGEDSPIPLTDFMYDYLNENGSFYSSAQNFYNLIPGTHYFYSNEGATLAAYLVENISGISFLIIAFKIFSRRFAWIILPGLSRNSIRAMSQCPITIPAELVMYRWDITAIPIILMVNCGRV